MISHRLPLHEYSSLPYGALTPVVGDAFGRLQCDTGGGSGPGFLLTDTVGTLAQLGGGLQDGAVARTTQQLLDLWALHRADAQVPDDVTVVAAVGGGNWVRQMLPDPYWLLQAAWAVDPAGGSDVARGDPAAPLATVAELMRRLERNLSLARAPIAVDILGDVTENVLVVNGMGLVDVTGALLAFSGTSAMTVLASATVTAATPADPATNTVPTITANVGGWTPFEGMRCSVTAGPNAGARFRVIADLGANTAWVSAATADQFDGTIVDLQVGDVVQVEEMVEFGQLVSVYGTGETDFVDLSVANDTVSTPGHALQSFNLSVFLESCDLPGGADSSAFLEAWNARFDQGLHAIESGGSFQVDGGFASANCLPVTRSMSLATYNAFTSLGAIRLDTRSTAVVETWLGVFDAGAVAVQVDAGATLDARLNYIWGTGSSTGIVVGSGGQVFYTAGTEPVVEGVVNDMVIGGVVTAYGALPAPPTAANLAMVVEG